MSQHTMEKAHAETEQTRPQGYAAQSFPSTTAHHVQRKPVPTSPHPYPTSREGAVDDLEKPARVAQVNDDNIGVSRPPPPPPPLKENDYYYQPSQNQHQHHDPKHGTHQYQTYTHTYPSDELPSRGASRPHVHYVTRLKHKYTSLSKRKRYLLLGVLVVVLILIIGVAVGVSRKSRFGNLPLPNNHGGPYAGELTYYDPGLGACGLTNGGRDFIVAVSHLVFDAVQVGSNPNANPLCGKKIRATRNGRSADLTVVDRCTGCKPQDLDVTRTVFEGLASIDQGRVPVTWAWLEDVPGGTNSS